MQLTDSDIVFCSCGDRDWHTVEDARGDGDRLTVLKCRACGRLAGRYDPPSAPREYIGSVDT